MSNDLNFQVSAAQIVNSVQTDIMPYEVSKTYTSFYETVVSTTGTVSLPGLSAVPSTAPFLEMISDQEVTFAFSATTGPVTITLTNVKYLAGNFKGYNFTATNGGATAANITWRVYI